MMRKRCHKVIATLATTVVKKNIVMMRSANQAVALSTISAPTKKFALTIRTVKLSATLPTADVVTTKFAMVRLANQAVALSTTFV